MPITSTNHPNTQNSGTGAGAGSLAGAEAAAQEAIVAEQLQTIDTKIEAKKNEAAYARANAWLSQSVG